MRINRLLPCLLGGLKFTELDRANQDDEGESIGKQTESCKPHLSVLNLMNFSKRFSNSHRKGRIKRRRRLGRQGRRKFELF